MPENKKYKMNPAKKRSFTKADKSEIADNFRQDKNTRGTVNKIRGFLGMDPLDRKKNPIKGDR